MIRTDWPIEISWVFFLVNSSKLKTIMNASGLNLSVVRRCCPRRPRRYRKLFTFSSSPETLKASCNQTFLFN